MAEGKAWLGPFLVERTIVDVAGEVSSVYRLILYYYENSQSF